MDKTWKVTLIVRGAGSIAELPLAKPIKADTLEKMLQVIQERVTFPTNDSIESCGLRIMQVSK